MRDNIFLSTPSARRATEAKAVELMKSKFLSTPSARRATMHERGDVAVLVISIHALREEGDKAGSLWAVCCMISIHALREEGDSTAGIMCRRPTNFYPRPPRGGRRLCGCRGSL